MKSGLIFGLMLLGSSCAPLPANQQSNGIQNANRSITTPTPEIVANDETDDSEKTTRVPPEFNGIDFKNFSYPTDWRKRRVKLKEGAYQHANPEGGGGDTFELDSIHFVDLHRDGRATAVVQLFQVSCGGSCDGGSQLFYFYQIRNGKPSLFWRIETTSLAYECGLKSFVISKRKLTLEVFKACQIKGSSIQQSSDANEDESEGGGKFKAKSFTRFVFDFKNGRFIKRRRQILPNPYNDVMNHDQLVSISD